MRTVHTKPFLRIWLPVAALAMLMNGCTSSLADQEGPANDDSKRGEPPRKISIAINGQSSTFPPDWTRTTIRI